MTLLALIRHAPTAWSNEGRMQGRTDVPLAAPLPDWRWPAALDGFQVIASPLRRAVETARLLGVSAVPESRLTEMDWGDWEGETLAALRARLGAEMENAEAQGLDFRPPGGESPRDVQARVAPLLRDVAGAGEPVAAITHKGVIRAIFAQAAGWDMREKPPARLSWEAAHLFRLDRNGAPSIHELNVTLARHSRESGNRGQATERLPLAPRLRGGDETEIPRP
ncbi:MAG TPA: histidine phosphatase family protein [Stellaceae bacterium]|jgi:probable phosphoglycerate mutase